MLTEKEQLFLRYEETTNEILSCAQEELPRHIGRRQDLIALVEAIDQRIRTAAEDVRVCSAKEILDAAFLRKSRNMLPEACAEAFDIAQRIAARAVSDKAS